MKRSFCDYTFLIQVYNGVQLLSLKAPPKEPTRYATRLAGVVFSKEEMLAGMVPPLNEKFERTPLDPQRISLIKRKCCQFIISRMIMNKWLCQDKLSVLVKWLWRSVVSPQIVLMQKNEKNYSYEWMTHKLSVFFFSFFFTGCIVAKYSSKTLDKLWPDIRRAINQKCNDLRKKQSQ